MWWRSVKELLPFFAPLNPIPCDFSRMEPRIRVWLLPCPKTMRLVSALSERRYFKMSHPVLHLSWNPGRVASLPLPKTFLLLPQRLSLSFYPFPLLASSPSSLGVTHPQAVPSGTLAYSSSEAQTPKRAGGGAEWAKALPPRFGRGQRPRQRRWLVGAGPAAGVGARRSGPGRERGAAGGARCGVEPGGVWRSCGGASRSPHAGRGSPKVSMGRGPCAAWARWRHPADARLRQVWFGRAGPGATSARSRSAGRWLAAAWPEYPEWGSPGRALVSQHLFTSLVPGSTPSPRTTQISRDLRYSRDFVFFKIHFWFVVQDWRRNSVVNLRCGFILTSCYYSDCRKSATGNGTVI